MRVLITGGCGFIGSNFTNYIISQHPDWNFTILDALTYAGQLNNILPRYRESKKFNFIQGDIRDRNCVENAVKDIDIIVHFAAESHVSYSFIHADLFADVNVRGTSILCESIIKKPIKKLICISSSESYGDCIDVPMAEVHPLLPKSPYAGSKAAADRLAYSYCVAFNLPIVILRPFNNYGPAQHTEKVIPRFITTAFQDQPLMIHDDGLQSRDWLYVLDHAKAIEKAIEADIDQLMGETINIGTGKELSIITIAQNILNFMNKKNALIVNNHQRPGQVRRHISSTEKAKKLLNWEAETTFDVGIKRTIEWYLENIDWWRHLKLRSEMGRKEEVTL